MTSASDLLKFARTFRGEVVARARGGAVQAEASAEFMETAFTERVMEVLAEEGVIEDGHACYFNRIVGRRAARVTGYSFTEDGHRLDVLTTIFRGDEEPGPVPVAEVKQAVDRAVAFVNLAGGLAEKMEPASPEHDMALQVREALKDERIERVHIIVVTDGIARESKRTKPLRISTTEDVDVEVRADVWDIQRLSRCAGAEPEPIIIDFIEEFGEGIPCLPVKSTASDYEAYLAVVPGKVLQKVYDDYGERLLELNVRSFLQARGTVNRGIRDTVINEPHLFFAFNNGLTAIAEKVVTNQQPDGTTVIRRVEGLQIVNGGQTTASLHRVGTKEQHDLSEVFVQMKLSKVRPELVPQLVPRISLYANSQNKVNEADFAANDSFHQTVETLSRSMWAPGERSRWFYERARGQYQVARARMDTPARVRQFDVMNPASQMFTKTDLAYFEHSWEQLPHLVSRGAQKNFRAFTDRIKAERAGFVPDETYFKHLIAKAIIFRYAQDAARKAGVGAYRANVVTYSVAYIANRLGDHLDLGAVWKAQAVPSALASAIDAVIRPVERAILVSAGGRNVTEWCKKDRDKKKDEEGCWQVVQRQHVDLPPMTLAGEPAAVRRAQIGGTR